MQVAEIVRIDGCQLVKLPEAFQLEGDTISIRRQGECLFLFDRVLVGNHSQGIRQRGRITELPSTWTDRSGGQSKFRLGPGFRTTSVAISSRFFTDLVSGEVRTWIA